MISSQFKKILLILFIVTSFLGTNVYASADITLASKSSTSNSVTITVKNNGPAGVDYTGNHKSIFNGIAYAVNPNRNSPDNSMSFGPIRGGETKEVTIANLNPSIAYSIEIQDEGFYSSSRVIKKITVTTKAGSVPCDPPKELRNGLCILPSPTCISPKILVNNECVEPTPSATICTPPKILVSGVCITPVVSQTTSSNECTDKRDNDGDGKSDWNGDDTLGVSRTFVEPDPSCFTTSARKGFDRNGAPVKEEKDDVIYRSDGKLAGLIPCTNKCTFSDIFKLLNNLLTFFITVLLIPIFITIIIYAGAKYILAQGNSSKVANLKSMIGNIVKGIILILCAWLIVRTIMTTLLNDSYKESGVEFLGK